MKFISAIIGTVMTILIPGGLLFCQNSFHFTIKDTLTDQIVNDAIELSDGGYILVCHEVFTNHPQKAHLLRISSTGKLLGTKIISNPLTPLGFIKISEVNQNRFILAGYVESNDTTNLWMYMIDSLFTEMKTNVFSFENYYLLNVTDLIVENSKILCSGLIRNLNSFIVHPFIYKFSPTLDSLQLRVFSEYITMYSIDVLPYDNKGYYCFCTGCGPAGESTIIIDTAFNIVDNYEVPGELSNNLEAKWISRKNYLLTGNRVYSNEDRCIGVLCLDTLKQLQNEYYIGDHDTIEWPGLRSRLDFIDTNKIYVGGTHNFCHSSEFCPVHCWFSLNQMDTTLSVNWQYFYGGDANYTLYGIRATKDKGCLMFGSRYDLNASSLERDIYVIKVNEDGLVFPTGIESPGFHQAIVYPNPGSDHLIIESGEQISGALFRMFSMEGKEVISKILWDRKIRIDTKFLNPGTYLWEISDKGKRIESGKWVKK